MKPYYKNELTTIYNGDCLEVMDYLIEQGIKVDAIITDTPYGTTACSWDSVIPFDKQWERLNKLLKPQGSVLLFGSEPFSTSQRMANIDNYKYDLYWLKNTASGFQHSKNRPMRSIEPISVFSSASMGHINLLKEKRMNYYPQGLIKCGKIVNTKGSFKNTVGTRPSHKDKVIQEFSNYPNDVLKFENNEKLLHPTQKPLELMKYLIETYTKKDDLILDFTSGSFTTCVASEQLNRRSIGIELEKKYCDVGVKRLSQLQMRLEI
jgi:site-specific DNA-methyltransferase (adenine-specific)